MGIPFRVASFMSCKAAASLAYLHSIFFSFFFVLLSTHELRPGLVRKNFQDSPLYRIFGRIHGALNIDANKN